MSTHILVVDDNPETSDFFRLIFRKQIDLQEWRFSFASDGKAAILELQEHSDIQIAIIDLMMPGMDGFELLSYIQHHYSYIVPIVMSADDNRESMRDTMRLGASDYLIKPATKPEVEAAIHKALQRYTHTLAATHHRLRQALELQAATMQTMNTIHAATQESHRYVRSHP